MSRSFFLQWIERPEVVAIFAAPPCGTASLAKTIEIEGEPDAPKPLRTLAEPNGLPFLAGDDFLRVYRRPIFCMSSHKLSGTKLVSWASWSWSKTLQAPFSGLRRTGLNACFLSMIESKTIKLAHTVQDGLKPLGSWQISMPCATSARCVWVIMNMSLGARWPKAINESLLLHWKCIILLNSVNPSLMPFWTSCLLEVGNWRQWFLWIPRLNYLLANKQPRISCLLLSVNLQANVWSCMILLLNKRGHLLLWLLMTIVSCFTKFYWGKRAWRFQMLSWLCKPTTFSKGWELRLKLTKFARVALLHWSCQSLECSGRLLSSSKLQWKFLILCRLKQSYLKPYLGPLSPIAMMEYP